MYKVYCDDTLICDSRVEELALVNPVINPEENKAGSFSFTIPPEHPYYDFIKRRKSIIQVQQDDEDDFTFSGICIKADGDFYNQKKVYCEGDLSFFNDSVQRPARYQGVSVRGLLEAYVANHNAQTDEKKHFQVGIVTVVDSNDYLYCYTNMESTMQALKEDLLDNLGGFFRVRHSEGVRYLDYLAESQNTCSQTIRLGKNLIDFKSNIDSVDIATAVIPLGARLENSAVEGLETRLTIEEVNDGKDYVFNQDAVNEYGWIHKTVEWDEVTTPEALKIKGEKYLSEIQFENVVVEAKAVDLHAADTTIERFKLSDQIRVVSKPHGMDRYFRLTKMTIYLNNPEKNPITLGKDERLSFTAKNSQANSQIKKAIEAISPNAIMKEAVANATQLLTKAMNGYVTTVLNDDGSPKELLIMDTPSTETATKVWRWNVNGLGYSSTGYNGEYDLAMTMDGAIVADRITTGTLNSVRINNGDGKFTVDERGNVVANAGTIAGWSIDSHMLSKTINLYSDMTEAGLANVGDNDPVQYIVWIRSDASTSATTPSFYIGYRPKRYYLDGGKNWYNIFVARQNGEVIANKFRSNNAEITGGSFKVIANSDTESRISIYHEGNYDVVTYPYQKILMTAGSLINYAQGNEGLFSAALSGTSLIFYEHTGDIESPGYGYGMSTIGNNYAYLGDTTCTSLSVSGNKKRIVKTDDFGVISQYCYEMASPVFGDIGRGVIDDTGACYIHFDPLFVATVSTDFEYYVFLQKEDNGDVWVDEKTDNYFVVKGTPGLSFAWEAKAKQKNYEYERLEVADNNLVECEVNYVTQASIYLSQYEAEVLEYEEIN